MLFNYLKFYPKKYKIWKDSMLFESVLPENINFEPKANSLKQISFDIITTTFNEESSIVDFLNSVYHQSIKANSVVICDANSSDKTVDLINSWKKDKNINLVLVESDNCSIAEGRNKAANFSNSEYLLFADAGTSLDKNWSEQIIYSFLTDGKIDLVAGWYKPIYKNSLQKAFAWFVLPDISNVIPESFLPSARSMGVKKSLFDLVGGFPQNLTFAGEDTLFSIYAKSASKAVSFNKNAFCYWKLPTSFLEMLKKVYRYSKGDGEIGGLNSAYYVLTVDKLAPIVFELALFIIFFWISPIVSYLFLGLCIYRVCKLCIEYGVHLKTSFKDILFRVFILLFAVPTQVIGFIQGYLNSKKIQEQDLSSKDYVVMMLEDSISSEALIEECLSLIRSGKYLTVIYNKFSDAQFLHAHMKSYKRSSFNFELWSKKHSRFIKNPIRVIDRVNDSLSSQLAKKFLK